MRRPSLLNKPPPQAAQVHTPTKRSESGAASGGVFEAAALKPLNFPSNPVHNRPAGGPLWKLDKDLKLRADLTQNDTISPCRVLDQVASMGFQLFACPECEYQNVYVFVRREGGL